MKTSHMKTKCHDANLGMDMCVFASSTLCDQALDRHKALDLSSLGRMGNWAALDAEACNALGLERTNTLYAAQARQTGQAGKGGGSLCICCAHANKKKEKRIKQRRNQLY